MRLALRWHPCIETFFASGGYEGSVFYWVVGQEEPLAEIMAAHEMGVSDIAWHPLGHVLASGSNDHTTKFWSRCRPGDPIPDRHFRPCSTAAYIASMTADQSVPDEDYPGTAAVVAAAAAGSIPGLPPPVAAAAVVAAQPVLTASMWVPGEAAQVSIPGMPPLS